MLLHKVTTGGVMTKGCPASDPCRQAYIDFNVCRAFNTHVHAISLSHTHRHTRSAAPGRVCAQGPGNDRYSWDPMTTLFAVRGPQPFWTTVLGFNTIVCMRAFGLACFPVGGGGAGWQA